ncbi:MAG: mechanosensitive ion channel [Nanoarchaeota archaeon]|nr:mechanosensitive ion channel [Nanoarchaeota archaeon]
MVNNTFVEVILSALPGEGILPYIATFLIILFFGWITGKIIRWVVHKILHIVGVDKFTKSTNRVVSKLGYRGTTVDFVSDLCKWVVYLIFISIAAQLIFGEQLLSNMLLSTMTYLPKVVVAIIFIIGGLIIGDLLGAIVSNLVSRFPLKLEEKSLIVSLSSAVTKVLVVLVAIVIALNVIGVYVEILTVGFGIIALTISLFILIGTKDLAINIFAGMYLHSFKNFRKGINVEVDGIRGTIKEIGLVFTTITNGKSEFHIPNYIFMRKSFVIK